MEKWRILRKWIDYSYNHFHFYFLFIKFHLIKVLLTCFYLDFRIDSEFIIRWILPFQSGFPEWQRKGGRQRHDGGRCWQGKDNSDRYRRRYEDCCLLNAVFFRGRPPEDTRAVIFRRFLFSSGTFQVRLAPFAQAGFSLPPRPGSIWLNEKGLLRPLI